MLISIIVPVYNVETYLIRCLNSIFAQTYSDYEVIVVDDGSTDESGTLAENFCANKARFCVYHKQNGGLMSAWKYGLEKAHGDYIGFVDSDDYIDKNMFQLMADRAAHKNVDIVMCNHFYDERSIGGGLIIHRNPIREGLYKGDDLNTFRERALPALGKDYISPSRCTKLIKKTILSSNLKYCDERISSAEDVNSMLPCLFSCTSIDYLDIPLYYYCRRNTSISYTFKEEILDSYSVLIDNLTKAAIDWETGLADKCRALTNYYGVLWCIYVYGSKLNKKEKIGQIQRLFSKRYIASINAINKDSGMVANMYKGMMLKQRPSFFLTNYWIHTTMLQVLRRIKK